MSIKRFEDPVVNSILLDCLARGDTFQSVLDRFSARFGIDISVVNIDGTQLYHAGKTKGKTVPEELTFQEQPWVFMGKVFAVKNSAEERQLICPIVAGESPYGAVVIYFDWSSDTHKMKSVGYAIMQAYRCFFNIGENDADYNIQNHIIARRLLLEEHSKAAGGHQAVEAAKRSAAGIRFRAGFAIAVFCPDDDSDRVLPADSLSFLSRYIPNSFNLRDEQQILALIYDLDRKDLKSNRALISSLLSYSEFLGLKCAVSMSFLELEERKYYVRQATDLLKYGSKNEDARLLLAEEYFADSMIFGAVEQQGYRFFLLSDIIRLIDHDKKNNTNYLDTLEAYLSTSNHVTLASKQLYIDRSTLKYRLDKIRRIITCDPDDPASAQRLGLSIQIYRMCTSSV